MAYLATLAALKRRLNISVSAHDTLLGEILDGVSMQFARECRRVIDDSNALFEGTWTETLDGGDEFLRLRAYPVISITSIKEDSDRAFTGDAVSSSDYVLYAAEGMVRREDFVWLSGSRVVQAVYYGGYEAAGAVHASGHIAMPYDLTEAAILQASFVYKRMGQEGVQSISAGQGSMTMYQPDGLLPGVRKLIAPFRWMGA